MIIRGSEVWQPSWQRASSTKPIFRGSLDDTLFEHELRHPFRIPLKAAPAGQHLTLGQVFVDGQPLRETDDAQQLQDTPATWMVAPDGRTLTVHFPDEHTSPTQRLVEITVRDRIFAPHRRGLGYLHVKGFTMEHCANQFPDKFWRSDSPQAGALGCRAGHHWLIEGNTVRFAKSIGIDCGYEGKRDLEGAQPTPQNSGFHVIRHNRVTDNGCCGIAGMRSLGTQIIGNLVARNNWNGHTAPEIAGIKVHYFVNGRIDGNLVWDNFAHGIWIDNVYRDARVTRNLVLANRGNGIFAELGSGPLLIDNNVIAATRPSLNPQDPRGDGLYSHDASGLYFLHNLVMGSHRFGAFHRKVTQRAGAGASNIQLLNNLFLGNLAGHLNMPYPGADAHGNRSDYNLYSPRAPFFVNHWGGNSPESVTTVVQETLHRPVELWNHVAPRLELEEWQQIMDADRHSVQSDSAAATLSDQFVLHMKLGHALDDFLSLPWQGLDRDYLGNLVPSHGALPGPFQGSYGDPTSLKLWPRSSVTPRELQPPASSHGASINRWHRHNRHVPGWLGSHRYPGSFTEKFAQFILSSSGVGAVATNLFHVSCASARGVQAFDQDSIPGYWRSAGRVQLKKWTGRM